MHATMWELGKGKEFSQHIAATVRIVEGEIEIEGDLAPMIRKGLQGLWTDIQKDMARFKEEFPDAKSKDEVFLRWLPLEYRGGYLKAEYTP